MRIVIFLIIALLAMPDQLAAQKKKGREGKGAQCREVATKAKIGGRVERVIATVCRQPDGSWRQVKTRKAQKDYNRAHKQVKTGRMLSLEQVLARLPGRYQGKLLDVQLRGDTYRLKMLSRQGQVSNLLVDGRSGKVLRVSN
jgi:uncharacterized membrane protein YkoI